ncbi:MAG: glutamine--fructose-6-phosphate transaminase (isomerizing) [Bdellovibrionota bacterium]
MCGIVGYVGNRPVVDILLNGLRRLEYRGYDSSGIAYFRDGRIEIKKSEGKLQNVEQILSGSSDHRGSTCGIGHTRWATHGKPTTQNAHPHRAGHVVLVHNGIIENYQEIKKDLIARGHKPESETDSELFGFLVLDQMNKGLNLAEAVRTAFSGIKGACSVVVLSEKEPGVIVGVRNGSPLVAAVDSKVGAIVASDAQPLLEISRDVYFLEHGDGLLASAKGLEFFSLSTGKKIKRESTHLDWTLEKFDKQGFPHFMLKEIFEQPTAILETFNGLLDRGGGAPFVLAQQPAVPLLDRAKELVLVACGSSYHAALLAKYWFELLADIPVSVEIASEFRYRKPVLREGVVVIAISQSGETADTLAVVRDVRDRKFPVIGLTNVRGSTLSREANAVLYTSAGPEVGVAATKTYMSQLAALFTVSGYLAVKKKGQTDIPTSRIYDQILKLPHILSQVLGESLHPAAPIVEKVRQAAKNRLASRGFFFIGRGYSFPVALEGALKLKDIAYVHAEGYAGGELKHGPIAMIDSDMTVVVISPQDAWREKTISNLEEVKSRGAKIIGIGNSKDHEFQNLCDDWIGIPAETVREFDECLYPFLTTPLTQLLSYELAVLKGTDVDKPRNLAKSVTVE